MKKITKSIVSFAFILLIAFSFVACGNKNKSDDKNCDISEKVTLEKVVLGEVEFENAETVKLEQNCDEVKVTGTINAMSDSQKSAYGVEDITHVVALKFKFDDKRTLKTFEIKGNTTKVYSTDNTLENYVGSLTDLLDNESDEDAFCKLILSANTKEYKLKSTYTDGTTSVIELDIEATLATASAE